jgi:hypothetical protein
MAVLGEQARGRTERRETTGFLDANVERRPESPVGDGLSLESGPLATFDRYWVKWW